MTYKRKGTRLDPPVVAQRLLAVQPPNVSCFEVLLSTLGGSTRVVSMSVLWRVVVSGSVVSRWLFRGGCFGIGCFDARSFDVCPLEGSYFGVCVSKCPFRHGCFEAAVLTVLVSTVGAHSSGLRVGFLTWTWIPYPPARRFRLITLPAAAYVNIPRRFGHSPPPFQTPKSYSVLSGFVGAGHSIGCFRIFLKLYNFGAPLDSILGRASGVVSRRQPNTIYPAPAEAEVAALRQDPSSVDS